MPSAESTSSINTTTPDQGLIGLITALSLARAPLLAVNAQCLRFDVADQWRTMVTNCPHQFRILLSARDTLSSAVIFNMGWNSTRRAPRPLPDASCQHHLPTPHLPNHDQRTRRHRISNSTARNLRSISKDCIMLQTATGMPLGIDAFSPSRVHDIESCTCPPSGVNFYSSLFPDRRASRGI
jgi:hypothetical protein